jgi:hypothetical protein
VDLTDIEDVGTASWKGSKRVKFRESLKRSRLVSKIKSISVARLIVMGFLLCSLFLSICILLRLLFTINILVKVFGIAMYCCLFFFIPLSAVLWLFYESAQRKLRAKTFFFLVIALLYILFWYSALLAPFIPEYLLLWFPVPVMVIQYAKWKGPASRLWSKRYAAIVASGLTIAVLLPNVAAFAGVNVLLNKTAYMASDSEKASFVYARVFDMTAFGWSPRAGMDYWKFLLSGAGACGEMAIANTNLMTASGLEARRVIIPGEDHAFVEVNIGGKWLVSDGPKLVTRAEMAAKRIGEIGSLSYVVAPTENSFIELTQQYVSTDTIIIRITRNGEPLADVAIALKHTFNGKLMQLPCDGCTFHTNVNGTVMLHIGKLHYIGKYKGSEEYYWIYANGQNTGHNVTSTGTGITQRVEIDLDNPKPA